MERSPMERRPMERSPVEQGQIEESSAGARGPDVGPASVGAVAQVFVEDLSTCAIGPEDVHHLARVLRLKPRETVVASDGAGSWRSCRFTGSAPWLEAQT